jgi:hypothetical protein
MISNSLKQHWTRHDISIEPGVSESDLKAFEQKYKISLPEDLHSYFVSVNGMSPGVSDDSLIRFWMLNEIKPISEGAPEYAGQNYIEAADSVFLFADYCIWSHAFGIRLSSEEKEQSNTVFIIGFEPAIPIANSFSEFVDIYLQDKERLTADF